MRPGGGKDKGSAFERATGQALSGWITHGERRNLFSRNVLSGGAFTVVTKKGIEIPNIPGDLMAASPLAFDFLSAFSIECKHRADLDLDVYLRDNKGTSFLSKTINHTASQSEAHGLTWIVIAKQNRHDPLAFFDHVIGREALGCIPTRYRGRVRFHVLNNDRVFVMPFNDFITLVPPDKFIHNVKWYLTQRAVIQLPPRRRVS